MRLLTLFLLLFLIADGCIERFDIPDRNDEPRMIVYGEITNGEGPHTVKINMSSDVGDLLKYPQPVMNAIVKIIDDLGNQEILTETKAGLYESSTLIGVVGRKYKLEFTTSENKTYGTEFQEMLPAGEISDLRFAYMPGSINEDDILKIQDAITVHIDSKGDQNAPNFFRWRWTGIFEVQTFPERRTRTIYIGETALEVPDPLPCSGFVVSADYQLVPVGPCECCHCWVTEYSQTAMVSNNKYVAQDEFKNILLAEIALNPNKFAIKYHIEVEQLSVTEEVYNFWRNVEVQQEGSQNIFQPNAIRIRGNIKNLSNSDEYVGGVFSVSAVARKQKFINFFEIPTLVKMDTSYDDCRHRYPGSTNIKPPFW
jgi:hypothetical protein